MAVHVERLTTENFHEDSLDGFIRHQEVRECWRCEQGTWLLRPVVFTENWSQERLREQAAELMDMSAAGHPVFIALDGDAVIGFAALGERMGSQRQYVNLDSLHVSEPWRGQGVGRRLFAAICDSARELGVKKLYISAHSSRESQAAYRALGCTFAQEIDPAMAAAEPYDVQMEYDLEKKGPEERHARKGKILFLNGVTSSGKTSIVEALQDRDDCYFYVVANDLFQEMVGERFLREDYWKHLSRVIILMYHTAKLYSDMGHDVLIDGILVERPELVPHYGQLREILRENPLYIIDVACPLTVCRERNIARGDRYEMQSDEQAAIMAKGIEYALRVETDKHTPQECAEMIVNTLIG